LLIALALYKPADGERLHNEQSIRRVCADPMVEHQARLNS
jgi:hypothetical protein